MPRSASKNAEAREKTQDALLEAGVAVLRKSPADELLSQVRVRDVTREAGVSPGAIYHYWPTQQEYRQALVEYMLEPSRFRTQGELTDTIAEIEAETERLGRSTIRGSARVGARANIERVDSVPTASVCRWRSGRSTTRGRLPTCSRRCIARSKLTSCRSSRALSP